MKRAFLVFFTLFFLPLGFSKTGESTMSSAYVPNPSGFVVKRGVNLSHWLSQRFKGGDPETFIQESDLSFIRSIGYDHVRIPVDEIELWTEDGKPVEKAFGQLKRALDWARKHELRAVVDLHTVRAHHFNAENQGGHNTLWTDPAAQDTFLRLWADLSAALKDYSPAWVAYEIMNEPVADRPQDWNALVAKAVKSLRALEPNRVLVIGSNRWQMASTFPDLEVPAGDPNLMLSVHTYEPLVFTHHTAPWTQIKDYSGPVHYPGQTVTPEELKQHLPANNPKLAEAMKAATEVWNRERLEATLRPAIDKARALGLQLYCGEFGCLPTVPRQDRLTYYADIVSVLEENGVAWCNWEYKADFGIRPYREATPLKDPAPDWELIDTLLKSVRGKR